MKRSRLVLNGLRALVFDIKGYAAAATCSLAIFSSIACKIAHPDTLFLYGIDGVRDTIHIHSLILRNVRCQSTSSNHKQDQFMNGSSLRDVIVGGRLVVLDPIFNKWRESDIGG